MGYGQYTSNQGEREIRKKFEKEIEDLETRLMDLKEQKLTNVKNVLLRNARGEEQGLVDSCFDSWAQEVKRSQKEGDSQKALKELNAQLNKFKGDQANKRKSVMARM